MKLCNKEQSYCSSATVAFYLKKPKLQPGCHSWNGKLSVLILKRTIGNSTVYGKKPFPSTYPVITFKSLLCSSKTSFAFLLSFQVSCETYIVPTGYFFSDHLLPSLSFLLLSTALGGAEHPWFNMEVIK